MSTTETHRSVDRAQSRPPGTQSRTGARHAPAARSAPAVRTAPAVRRPPVARPSSARPSSARAHGRVARTAPSRVASTYPLLALVVAVLCLVGLVMVLSASSVESIREYGTPWHYFERQLLWLAVGAVSFVAALRIGPGRLRRGARPAVVVVLILLVAVLVPGVGVRVAGASRWLGTASFQVQPSELAKLVLVGFAADVLDRRAERPGWREQMVPVLAVLAIMAALVMAQPDMGTTMVLACIALGMLFTAGMPVRPLAVLLGAGVALFGLLAVAAPYRLKRLTSFLNPLADSQNTGYQPTQGLAALGHGRLIGDGFGSSISSWGYLPNAPTDFIFAVIGEEAGLIGTLAITALFAGLAVIGTRVACRSDDRHAALVAAGVTAWLVGQAVINIGAVVGLLPVTGVPLPFVSFGGSSMVIALFGVGLVAHTARRS